ncbi:MAG: methylenetetrahydromethanopterin dehydrogenase [Thiotrichales bacterium]|nr:methylenetetrahydromethanopterin dehydrogenase [Thiotrichales bacterium]
MKDPYLLHMFNPTKNVSPFDVNMAYEASFQGVIPYSEVALEDIHALTQDTIFSRGPKGVKRTCIFIGGREFGLAMDMLNRAKMAMVPPFEVSVFADPSGAITTAAATIACLEALLAKNQSDFRDKNLYIFGGTGPVGVCAGILASNCGANVYLASHRGAEVGAKVAEEYNSRFDVTMGGANSGSDAGIDEILQQAHVIIGAAKAGIQILGRQQLEKAGELEIAADINAVPPLGFEGIEVHDNGQVLDFTPNKTLGLGALAIGDVKYKVHKRLFEMMIETDKPLYLDHVQSFEVARTITNQ